jgi:hypothetical protein
MLHRLKYLCAPEGDSSGGGGGAAPAAPAPDGAPAAPAAPSAPDLASLVTGLGEVVRGLKAEIVDMRREARKPGSVPAPTASTSPVVPAAPSGVTWTADTRLTFRDELEQSGLSLPPERRNFLEKVAKADGVTEGFGAWALAQAEILGWKRATAAPTPAPAIAAPAPTAPAAPAAPANPGAPAGTASGHTVLPDDFSQIPESVVAAMTPAEAKAHFDKVRAKGQQGHPFARQREAAKQQNQASAQLSAQLAAVLAQNRK